MFYYLIAIPAFFAVAVILDAVTDFFGWRWTH